MTWPFLSSPELPVNSPARKRWMLFYTLMRNPHLILLRKQHLSSSQLLQTTSPQSETTVHAWIMALQAQSRQAESQSLPELTVTPAEDCWRNFPLSVCWVYIVQGLNVAVKTAQIFSLIHEASTSKKFAISLFVTSAYNTVGQNYAC